MAGFYTRTSNSLVIISLTLFISFAFSSGVLASTTGAAEDTWPLVTSTKVTPTKLIKNRINTVTVTFGFQDLDENLRNGLLTLNLISQKSGVRLWTFKLTEKIFNEATGSYTFQLSITPEENDTFELFFWLRDSAGNNGGNESDFVSLEVKSKAPKNKQGRKKGDVAYNFTLLDQNGSPVSLSDYKGKVVLLDFCTMWCNPCKKEAFLLDSLYQKYKEQGLMILSVVSQNHDGQPPTAKECKGWAKAYGLSTPVLTDPLHGVYEGYTKKEQITRKIVPYNVIIDRKGVIRWNKFAFNPSRFKQIEKMIKNLLEE